MKEELSKFGVEMTVEDDLTYIPNCKITAPATTLCSHNDHRIVMSIAVLLTAFGGTIEGAEAVAKSYPDFFEVLKSLGVEIYET